ncbi:hypothetical protein [Ferruginibacter profundus]
MKTFLVISLILLSTQAIAQDSANSYALKKELIKVWPKKLISFKATVGQDRLWYRFDKQTSMPFMVSTVSFAKDTSFRFIYFEGIIRYAEFIFWANPKKKKGALYRYYLTGSKFVPLKKTKNDLPDLTFLSKKGMELYELAQQALINKSNSK